MRIEAMRNSAGCPRCRGGWCGRCRTVSLEKREQTILFINRRGYSSSMLCTKCGHVEECAHCSIAMTYHRTDETLRCHLCGDQRAGAGGAARSAGRRTSAGAGSARSASRRRCGACCRARESSAWIPTRWRRRTASAKCWRRFRAGKIDVLVGTQMIGKGLDFPNVTLVGLVDADISMHVPDFRANERTFQLLVQVAGRAGRGDRAGEVIVQTFTPQAEAIQFSRHADLPASPRPS
jgi:primosomal protein N' (replication factor Y)